MQVRFVTLEKSAVVFKGEAMPKDMKKIATFGSVVGWLAPLQFYLTTAKQLDAGKSFAYGAMIYFGYFTILTNILCSLVLTAHALPQQKGRGWYVLRQPWLVASATVSIIIVGSIYFVILSSQHQLEGLQLIVDRTLHYFMPPFFAWFFWQTVQRGSIDYYDILRMAIYPGSYLSYYLIRGEITGLYPYFFINVSKAGYEVALRNAMGVVILFSLLCAIAVRLKKHAE